MAPLLAAHEPSCRGAHEEPPARQSAHAETDATRWEERANAAQQQRNHDRSRQLHAPSDECTDADRDTFDLGNPLHILGDQGSDGLEAPPDRARQLKTPPVTTHGGPRPSPPSPSTCVGSAHGLVSMCYDHDFAPSRGLSPRKLFLETTLPGCQLIPSTARTSTAPSPCGVSTAALPVAWL